ncbi:MAG: hypothetical protein J0M18_07425 [Ignavibacteria bacterium]|nr:hypothetical protein [Ignavibacteria bacterium]
MQKKLFRKNLTPAQNYVFWILFLIVLIASLFLQPYGDDIGYLTEPAMQNDISSVRLLPKEGRWRIIDALYGVFLTNAIWAYPFLNHIIVVAAHFISIYLFFLIARRFGFSNNISFTASILFGLAGNIFATVFSIDSLNQSLSLAFGALSIWACLKNKNPNYFLFILWSVLSVAAKESGFLFFIIGPLLYFTLNHFNIKNISLKKIKPEYIYIFATGIFLLVSYFIFTFGFDFISSMLNRTNVTLYRQPLYKLPFFGIIALLGRTIPVDLPALLLDSKQYLIGIISILFGLPLMVVAFYKSVKLIFKGEVFPLVICLIIVTFAASHSSVGAITEMNSYPCIFFASFLFLPALRSLFLTRIVFYKACICMFLFASTLSIIHKYSLILQVNEKADIIVNNIKSGTTNIPNKVYIMLIDNESIGHDLYHLIPSVAARYGLIMRHAWNKWDFNPDITSYWINADILELIRTPQVVKIAPANAESELKDIVNKKLLEYDAVWMLYQNGKVDVFEKKDFIHGIK